MPIQKPKGTEDFYPEDEAVKQALFSQFRNVAQSFGFQEVSSPAFENFELLSQKEGEEIKQQIFTLEKRGDENFGLRFDLTIPNTRLFMQKQQELQKPVKWITCDRMWRYERPQKGRLREFYQMNMEIFGSQNPEADAEVITAALTFFQSLELTEKEFEVRLNNRKLLQGLLTELVGEKRLDEIIRLIDKREKMEVKEWEAAVKAAGVKEVIALTKILDMTSLQDLEKIKKNDLAQEGFAELKQVYELLDKNFVRIHLSTARGLAYYTSTVFEFFDKSGKYRALCGGGRYDKLVELFGGQPTPATGYAIGLSTLRLLLEDLGKLPQTKQRLDYYIAPLDKKFLLQALTLASTLRKKSSVDVDLMQRSLGKQMSYAKAIGAENVIVIGDQEIKTKTVKIKNLKTGKETSMKL
ncbi:histidine--tRNA ligase [Candidatus Woesearchaeota archaeon]|nr:histidine--tRNA ligase [Candidatus Woesearchaeota archaeon]